MSVPKSWNLDWPQFGLKSYICSWQFGIPWVYKSASFDSRGSDRATAKQFDLQSIFFILQPTPYRNQPKLCSNAGMVLFASNVWLPFTLNYRQFSGHSLRRGFLTSASGQKADVLKLIAQSRHKQLNTLMDYVKDPELFVSHATEHLLQVDESETEIK